MKLQTCNSPAPLGDDGPSATGSGARAEYLLHRGDVLDVYQDWPRPDAIISDGAYGLGGFPGDPPSAARLPEWYAPHAQAWSKYALPSTALWFWNTEQGWASCHPLLMELGWVYEQTIVWDKGLGHAAGNSNGQTLRRCGGRPGVGSPGVRGGNGDVLRRHSPRTPSASGSTAINRNPEYPRAVRAIHPPLGAFR